jgi:hypothetical protein
MAETTPTTEAPKSAWSELWDKALETGQAILAGAKDYASIKKTDAETKALKNLKEQPNWAAIGLVVLAVVVVGAGIWALAFRKK